MSKTIEIHRVPDRPPITRVASGVVEHDFDGPGPFTIPAEHWPTIEWMAGASFTRTAPKPRRTAKAEESES